MDKFQRPKSSLTKSVDKHHKSVDKRLSTKENQIAKLLIFVRNEIFPHEIRSHRHLHRPAFLFGYHAPHYHVGAC